MTAVLFRVVVLALGLGLAELGLTAFARGELAAFVELGIAIGLLVAGSAGFMGQLLGGIARGGADHG